MAAEVESISPSILQRIIKESLAAFPDEAHLKVLSFFESKKVSEASSTLLKNAWSKAVLSHDAFGRGRKSSLDSEIFFNDFMEELLRHFSDSNALRKLSQNIDRAQNDLLSIEVREEITEHQQKSMEAILTSLDATQEYIRKYIHALYSLPESFLQANEVHETSNLDALVQYQEVMRKLKPVWHRQGEGAGFVHPINEPMLFEHSYRSAKLVMGLDDVVDPPIFFSSVEAIGVDLPHDHSSASDAAWSTFGYLHDFVCCRYFNIFPKPITVVRQEETFGSVFVFESPSCRPLRQVLGIPLAIQLRKNPSIISVWCTQFALAAQAMSTTVAQLTSRPSLAKDVLIRDDGMLLIGGVSFAESEVLSSSSANLSLFTPIIYDILSNALCISRCQSIILPQIPSFSNAGAVFLSPSTFFDDSTSQAQLGSHNFLLSTYSHLTIKVACGRVADAVLMSRDRAYQEIGDKMDRLAELEHYFSILVVVTAWVAEEINSSSAAKRATTVSEPVVKVKVVSDPDARDGVYAVLDIYSTCPGKLIIECSSLIPNAFNMNAAEQRLGNIQVHCLEMPPTESVAVQEVMGFIEERHCWSIDTAIYNSHLFLRAREFMFDEKDSKELMIQCATDWSNIRRLLRNTVGL